MFVSHGCKFPDDEESWFQKIKNKIEDFYWGLIPYETRPGRLWYRFKCWAWHRHSTVKPQYLSHTWCDRVELLPHVIFQVLSDFIEKERPDETIDWEADEDHSKAWAELQRIYKWWHETYIPWTETYIDKYHFEPIRFEKTEGSKFSRMAYESPEAQEKSRETSKAIYEEEEKMNKELVENCKKLIDLKDYLWT